METLPLEMVLKISGYLTPQDLARCCGVCLNWREMFNDDCHWRPHCDPELAEHLSNTPSVVEPVFVTPEATNNLLLTPIGHWRLAVMREEHLWKNLKQDNYKKEEVVRINNEIWREILTNTLVVRWCKDRIEIWDVSVTPIVFVAKTDPSVDLGGSFSHCAIRNSTLVVEQLAQIKVFHVDTLNKRVELSHDIPWNETSYSPDDIKRVTKENIYVRVHPGESSLKIIDLDTGELKRNEPCPAVGNGNENARIDEIKISPTSDILIVGVQVSDYPFCVQYHLYSLRQLTFLAGPEVNPYIHSVDLIELHEHYLIVVVDIGVVKIYNCHTSELIYNKAYANKFVLEHPSVFNNSFIFALTNDEKEGWLEMVSPTDSKITTFSVQLEFAGIFDLATIGDKIVYVYVPNDPRVVGVWRASGGTLERCDFHFRDLRFNQALSIGVFDDYEDEESNLSIYHYW